MHAARTASAFFFLFLLSLPAAADDLVLEQVVVLSRHSVRSPTRPNSAYADFAAQPWPEWSVAPGELTPHGAKAARLMGGYYRAEFSARGLAPASGCPKPGEVYFWSDLEQRTRLTAQEMLDGMFPGCGLKIQHLPLDTRDDPLFHPTEAGVCAVDPAAAQVAVLGRIGGNFSSVMAAYAAPFARMQAVLGCCSEKVCSAQAGRSKCTLAELPSRMEGVSLRGPISTGSTLAEIFLLEYTDGKPMEQVAWGKLDEAGIRDVMSIHTLLFDLRLRTPYIATQTGSNLADQALSTLRRTVTGRRERTPRAPAGAKVVFYVGHDSNIANVGGMLGLDWSLTGYQPNDTPPGGALTFELLRHVKSGERFVRVVYYAQTPGQLRQLTPLSREVPPARAEIALPGCAATAAAAGHGMACPWAVFERAVTAAIAPGCVGEGKPQRAGAKKD